ncbi:MAG: YeeE/YedE family protein [Rhizobiales bacterium]|nr:YeeE/YedE family protein [Hyphomicrobiales bacterium]
MTLVFACIFAALLGFAAHRASVCTVRAVAEMFSSHTGYMLLSIAKSAIWVLAITVPVLLLMPGVVATVGGWQLTAASMLGGFIFGIGAAANGACAYSTMGRLVDGEVGMLMTIVGFAVGVFVFVTLVDWQWMVRPAPRPTMLGALPNVALVLSFVLLAWVLYEIIRLWRTRPPGSGLKDLILAPQYRLSSSAMLIGLASSVVFLFIGSPGYSATLQNVVEGIIGSRSLPTVERGILLLSVLFGMAISTVQRGSFKLEWQPRPTWLRNIFGGALMGLGTAMLPGGNDALILYGIPSFSPHALPSYVTLAIGIALGLFGMRYLLGFNTRVECRNDIYRAEAQPRGSILNSHPPRQSRN